MNELLWFGICFIALALLLTYRLIKGPRVADRAVCADRSWQNSASRIRFEFLFPKRMENIGSIRLGNCFRVHSQRTI